MPLNVILAIAFLACFAACVNGYLGAGILLFFYIVLQGMVRQRVPIPASPPAEITEYTWAPQLVVPVIIFLVIWQWRLRGRIGPQWGLRDIVSALRGRRSSSFA